MVRDAVGERFVDELVTRDELSRAITMKMAEQGVDHLWLDVSGLERFDQRFPTIAATVGAVGLDPGVDWLPIAPAAHYLCGGVVTDLDGATSLPGLWACGEVACTGVHGANRLASNSLLEGMVFAPRVVEAIDAGRDGPLATGAMRAVLGAEGDDEIAVGGTVGFVGPSPSPRPVSEQAATWSNGAGGCAETMTSGAGVVRTEASPALGAGRPRGAGARLARPAGRGPSALGEPLDRRPGRGPGSPSPRREPGLPLASRPSPSPTRHCGCDW